MWVYGGLLAGVVLSIIFLRDYTMSLPLLPIGLIVSLFGVVALHESWESWKRKGKAFICDLELGSGGHTTIHFYDTRKASRFDQESNKTFSFACLALGGFYYRGIGVEGADFFVVCPTEHLMNLETGVICLTKLFKTDFNDLTEYIQEELTKLKGFNKHFLNQNTIYFGMCSDIDGTATDLNFATQERFAAYNHENNYLKNIIKDIYSQQKRAERQNQPTVIQIHGATGLTTNRSNEGT